MVSGFFTSPCDHWRMSSAVARPIRSSSKKLTSSTSCLPALPVGVTIAFSYIATRALTGLTARLPGCSAEQMRYAHARRSHFLDAARLAAGQVDAQLLRGPEDVLVGLTHL